MATVSIFMPELSLTTGNVLWLRKSSDYSVVNTGGDALTESGTSGWFTATVTETWTEQLSVTIVDTNGLIPRAGWIPVGGTTVIEGTAVLDPAYDAAKTAATRARQRCLGVHTAAMLTLNVQVEAY